VPPQDIPPAIVQPKLFGRAFYESIGSPKKILAPMVDQSEFVSQTEPFRHRTVADEIPDNRRPGGC